MSPRHLRILYNTGLLFLMMGLFVSAFVLNRRQFEVSLTSLEASFERILRQEARSIYRSLDKAEEEFFSLDEAERFFSADLFFVTADQVVPVCTQELLEVIPTKEADLAFAEGLKRSPHKEALPFFKKAAKREVNVPNNLYMKIGALFHCLELRYKVSTVCCIDALLKDSAEKLTDSQRRFFSSMLAGQVDDLEMIQQRHVQLREYARRINAKLVRQRGAYRTMIDGRVLSIRGDGLAVWYKPDIEVNEPVLLLSSPAGQVVEEVLPGTYIHIPEAIIEEAKQLTHKQYKTGSAALWLILVLCGVLIGGIRQSAKRQRELDSLKTEFVATVSHELRTPLSLIRLHAETLHHGRAPHEKQSEYTQIILNESERLSGIVNNVLDFSRMERNKLQLQRNPTDLSALCERVVASFSFRLEQDAFSLKKEIQSGIIASTDSVAFSQILFNLLDNAIKYSDEGKEIGIRLEQTDDQVVLKVADHGIGIPDNMKGKIFDDFVRSDSQKVTARRGSGIGLSVTKRLLDELEGTIEVLGNQPKGSVFVIRFEDLNEIASG